MRIFQDLRAFGAMIAIHSCEVRNTKNSWRNKIMKPTAKPVKKGKTLGGKKLEKKTTLSLGPSPLKPHDR
jgi:hypothetical protein